MEFRYTLKHLQACKKRLESDIEWYKQKNKLGVNLSDEYRKNRISELTTQHTEVVYIIQLLSNDRFHAVLENLIQFNLIEANIMALESMVKMIDPKRPKMKRECLNLIKDILQKYFPSED